MNTVVAPGPKTGRVRPPCSKSQAHRLLICAALSGTESVIYCDGASKDIEATAECLRATRLKMLISPFY